MVPKSSSSQVSSRCTALGQGVGKADGRRVVPSPLRAGFVLAIMRCWPAPEAEYRAWYGAPRADRWPIGAVQLVPVAESCGWRT